MTAESKAWDESGEYIFADWEIRLLRGESNVSFIPLEDTPIFGDIPMPVHIFDRFQGEGF